MWERDVQVDLQSFAYNQRLSTTPRIYDWGVRTACVVDDEFIADDDASPVPHFKHDKPEDDCSRDQRHEPARGGSDAGLLHSLLEDVERAEPAFRHPRGALAWAVRLTDDVDPLCRGKYVAVRTAISGAISSCFRFGDGKRREEGNSHEYL